MCQALAEQLKNRAHPWGVEGCARAKAFYSELATARRELRVGGGLPKSLSLFRSHICGLQVSEGSG